MNKESTHNKDVPNLITKLERMPCHKAKTLPVALATGSKLAKTLLPALATGSKLAKTLPPALATSSKSAKTLPSTLG
jgi:hypothetical protein